MKDNIDDINFFGVNRKKNKRTVRGPFSFSVKTKSTYGLAPSTIRPTTNYFGIKNVSKSSRVLKVEKKPSFLNIPQSYWNANQYNVPIWMQRNDDNRLGGKSKEDKPKGRAGRPKKTPEQKYETASKKTKETIESMKKMSKGNYMDSPAYIQLKTKAYIKNMKGKQPSLTTMQKILAIENRKVLYNKPHKMLDVGEREAAHPLISILRKSAYKAGQKKSFKEAREELAGGIEKYKIKTGEIAKEKGKEALKKLRYAIDERISGAALKAKGEQIAKGTVKMLGATYGKGERVATAKVQRLVKGGLGAVFGDAMLRPQTSRGRPHGPSGRYKIEGKPVFEEEYQKWAASQRAMNRITPSIAQEAPATSEEMQNIVGQPSTAEQQIEQMSMGQPKNEQQYATGNVPMTPGEIEASKYREEVKRGPTNEEVKMAQEIAQQQDNVLNAPSFMKGELKATGGSLLTTTGPQIMDAPNAFKGQLRNLNRGDPASMGEVKLGERPQTNPYGDEYIDIELGSGRPVLKKRPREKWVTGEAL